MRATRRSRLGAALGVVAMTTGVAWLSACGAEPSPPEASSPSAASGAASGAATGEGPVAVVEEVTGPAIEWASGEVASARHTAVASRVLARIEEIRVSAGSAVSEGDVLVVLDARDLRARVGEAEEALRSSEARLELARRDQARVEELFRSGVAPQRQLDEVTSGLRAARADVAGRRQALDEARAAASFAEIRSPVSGRVVDRLAEPGDTAVPGRPLLRIYDPTILRVEAPVRESLAVDLEVGALLSVDVPALGGPVEGRIDEIVPFAEPGARTLLVKVSLPRTDARLFAGMFARVAIPAGERRSLVVPASAVEQIGQLEFVTVVASDGAPERRLVTTGEPMRPGTVEVLSGLRPGERVRLPEGAESPARDAASVGAEAIARAREALGRALREALSRGPEQAIDVCRIEAPRIARSVARPGVTVGRTSQRLRNPANAPEPWMVPLLEEFAAGAPRSGSNRSVDLGPRGTGVVEPITVQPLCTTCHGENVEPALLARIREAYPEDRAIGYRVGDFRGLFWAVVVPQQP